VYQVGLAFAFVAVTAATRILQVQFGDGSILFPRVPVQFGFLVGGVVVVAVVAVTQTVRRRKFFLLVSIWKIGLFVSVVFVFVFVAGVAHRVD